MSPLLTEFNLKQQGASSQLELFIDVDKVVATLSYPLTKSQLWTKEWPLISQEHALQTIVTEIDRLLGTTAPVIQLIVADPEVKHFSLEVEQMPKKERDIAALILWRLKEEHYLDAENYHLDYSLISEDKKWLSVFAVKKSTLDDIVQTLQQHNLLIDSLVPSSLYTLQKNSIIYDKQFFITLHQAYTSYGVIDLVRGAAEFQSHFTNAGNEYEQQQFLTRARRSFSAMLLENNNNLQKNITVIHDDVFSDELRLLFPGFQLFDYKKDGAGK